MIVDLEPAAVGSVRSAGTGQAHPKRCYPEAAKYQQRHHDVTLVHATIEPGWMHPFGHAWCELPEGIVYDGADGRFYNLAEYRDAVSLTDERRFTWTEATERILELNATWGPWDQR